MRERGFIIFIIIFTVLYTIFFLVYDNVSKKYYKKRLIKMAKSLIVMDKYLKFSSFYGIQGTASIDDIIKIYLDYIIDKNSTISIVASYYKLNIVEFAVIILYLEYLDLIPRRIVSINNNFMKMLTFDDQKIIMKYEKFFREKKDYNYIISIVGKIAVDDLKNINNNNLIPGIRVLDSKVYYVGNYL